MGKIINIKTAQLASFNGFDVPVYSKYEIWRGNQSGELRHENVKKNWNREFADDEIWYSAPSQSILQTWLRENGIDVFVIDDILKGQKQDYGDYYYVIKTFKDRRKVSDAFLSYEDALEEGLQEALNILEYER